MSAEVMRAAVAIAVVGCAGARAAAPPATPARLALPLGVIDRGELAISIRGRVAGSEVFTIERTATGHRIASEVQLHGGGALRVFDNVLDTDRAWRPLRARGRDVRDGGTRTELTGDPLTLSITPRLAEPTVRTASRAVDLYLADDTYSHFAPACALAAGRSVVAFPGMDVAIGADVATALPAVTRRTVDLAGAVRAVVTCRRGRLLAVELPTLAVAAVRSDLQAELAPLVLPRALKAPLPSTLREHELTIDRPDATLACALVVPAGPPAPVAVLVTGSGAQDRDADTVGPGGIKLGLLRAIAAALGGAGVATLRCDDRGTGDSSGVFGDATLDTFIADVQAMIAVVRRDPRVAGDRVAVVGHSEGAVVAAAVAAADPAVAAAALLAGPGRPLDQVLLDQVARTLARAGLTPGEAATAVAHHRAALTAIAAGAPVPDTAEAREWRGGERWLRSHLVHDGLAAVAGLGPRPVFLARGALDQQVTAADADTQVAAARRGGARVADHRYPRLDHLFAASSRGDPATYADPRRTVDPAFLADLAAFTAAALGAPAP